MKAVLFVNFSDELFAHPSMGGKDALCRWDGEPYAFAAGSKTRMQDYKAKHFAKHLVNRELGKTGDSKKISQMSPKDPEQAPDYTELFNKAFIPLQEGEVSEARVMDEVVKDADVELVDEAEEPKHPVKVVPKKPTKKLE